MFALQSEQPVDQDSPPDLGAVLKYSLRQAVTSHGVFSCIPFLVEISRKGLHFRESSIYRHLPNLSPNCQNGRQVRRQGQGAITVA
ncbi:hypothetical protein AVEN_108092-1 [Araneus ventricosus]|uniref:Uncharacterized protein n=1 Tax=Araneus ventricosus TaxID=182803 RepID=A0A4Y2PV05_ARAVE|nr:hypothetical protein AVEN_108092-1 [Araneus ventricosus]